MALEKQTKMEKVESIKPTMTLMELQDFDREVDTVREIITINGKEMSYVDQNKVAFKMKVKNENNAILNVGLYISFLDKWDQWTVWKGKRQYAEKMRLADYEKTI